jgi:histidine kinase/DNA gyrase B/HSP90-like ATPase
VLRAELSTDRASVQIHVADNGCGISSAHLQHIFDRLYQVSSENDESRKGLGLGLYICQQLVQLHGGRIWASSELSHGTEISFSIPVFSISRQLAPIMESTARADSVALFTVEISFNDKLPDRMDQDDTAVEVECILERCMMPDFDVLLPLRHMRVRHETFYLVARADHRGADVLRQRICNQLERSTLLTANGAGYTIAFEIMEFSASAIDGNRLQDLAQLTAAIEGRVTVAPRLTQ